LVGYWKMGKAIDAIATGHGHEIGSGFIRFMDYRINH
jgi:hypothetical protein